MIRVHITDDHKMFIEGISNTINGSGIATVCGCSYTASSCRKAIFREKPDILLLDITLPDGNGIDLCREISILQPDIKVIGLTTHDEISFMTRMMDAGASGYILKNSLSEEVILGIEAVMEGKTFLCGEIEAIVERKKHDPVWLTAREQELLRLIVDGYTNQEIAEKVFLSIETIKTYRKNLIIKLGARNSMMLVKMALEKKLI